MQILPQAEWICDRVYPQPPGHVYICFKCGRDCETLVVHGESVPEGCPTTRSRADIPRIEFLSLKV